MRRIAYLIPILILAGCSQPTCITCWGGIVSDAQITFTAQGQDFKILDREGEALATMTASYNNSDSTLYIRGYGSDSPNQKYTEIWFVVRAFPYPSKTQYGLPDTGTLLLDLSIPQGQYTVNSALFEGGASVTISDTTFFTNSKQIGTLRITGVDTINNKFNGVFNFLSFDSSTGDTLRVDSGIISRIRIN